MSYMDDDTDPFGIPYTTTTKKQKAKSFTINDLNNLIEKRNKLNKEINDVEKEIGKAEKELKEKLKKYTTAYSSIEFDKCYGGWKIITKEFKLTQLEKLKNDFNFKDIKVEMGRVKINGDFKDRIIIRLI